MENPTTVILSLILSITIIISIPSVDSQNPLVTPIITACPGLPKSSKIQFYVQNRLSGINQTVYEVAQSSITITSPVNFGEIRVVDDKMTAGPYYNSPEVGRAQGTETNADLKELALALNMNFLFTSGIYNGSTISIVGRNPLLAQQRRELSVVGGTGKFRCARGYAVASTYSIDMAAFNGVFLYTIYANYYN